MNRERGFVLIAVMMALVLVASIALMLTTEGAVEADRTGRGTEALQADYLAQAALAHALWQNESLACAGEFSLPTTTLGAHSYTASIAGGGTTTAYSLSADQDAWIRDDQPADNKGGDSNLHIKDSQVEQPLYRFDLSSLPAGAQINSAIASFHVSSGHPEGPVTVHRITAAWNEGDVTWDSISGSVDSQVLDTIPAQPDNDVRVQVNLTAQVQAWVNGEPNNGILLASTAPGIHAQYASRESAGNEHPRLDVIVGTVPASPVSIQATGTLANGVTRTRSRPLTPAYQPPNITTLQLNADPGEDAILDSFYDARNYGGANYLQVHDSGTDWQQYPLIRFDLSRLPPGALVRSAQLELNLQSLNAPGSATIHQVKRSWVEGTRSGGGTADGATWFTHDGTNAWASAGGDYDVAHVAETAINGAETWVSWEIAPLVERWLAGEPNNGLLIKSDGALAQVKFASREDTNSDLAPKLTITYSCECGTACLAPQGSGTILMSVVNPTTLVPADAYKKALFESWGYTVSIISESANQSDYDTALATSDLAFISETVNSNNLGTKLADTTVGVVSQDGDYNSDLGLADGSSWSVSSAVNVTDSGHYITQVFPSGPLEIYSAAMEQVTVSGAEAAGLSTLAETAGAGSLVALEQGATTSGGGSAAGRRVLLPFGREANLSWEHLNNNGLVMLQRAFAWAMGAGTSSSGNLLMVVGDAGSPATSDLDRKALIESWGYAVTLIDDGDSQANFDTAAAANDVVYIAGSGSSAAVGTKLTAATIGVLSEDIGLVDELGIAQPSFLKRNTQSIDIFDNTHYVTSGFSLGTLQLYSYVPGIWTVTGLYAPGLQILAGTESSGSSFPPGLALLEAGAELYGGGFAAGRRLQVPWSDGNFDINALNADGQTIMRRSIEWAAGAAGPTSSALMVVVDPANPSAQETARQTLLGSFGYAVTLIDDDDSQANFDTAASANDIAYVPPSVNAGTLGTKLVNASIGVVNEQPALVDEFGFGQPGSVWKSRDEIDVLDNTHYIMSEFATGLLTITSSPQDLYLMTATLGAGFEELARAFNTGAFWDATLGVIEAGAALHGGGTAAGRRVQLPWSSSNFDINALNADGITLLRRSFEWAAGASGSQQEILLVVADATNLSAQDIARQTLMADWGYQVATISASDSQANFDAAVATANAAYVVMQNSSTTLGTKLRDATIAVINEEVELRQDIGFSANRDWPTTRDNVDIIVDSHYITSPFTTGLLTIATAPIEVVTLSGQMAGGLLVLGQQDWGGLQNSLSVIDTGGALYGGGNAAGRRVQLPWGRVGFDINDLNADGLTIMRRAIEWGIAGGGGGGGGGPGGGGGIVFEEFTEGRAEVCTSSAEAVSIPKPGGTIAGDLLIAAVATNGDTASTLSSSPTWNLTQLDVASASGAVTFGVWWKIADGTEGSQLNYSWTGGEQAYGWIMRFSGHDPSSPVATSSMTSGTNRTPPSTNLITSTDGNLILRLGGFDDDDIDLDAPGLSGHTVITMDRSNTGNNCTVSGGAGYVIQTTAGDTGSSTFSLTGREQYRTVTIAIRPEPSP